jgi:hypothetical protein
MLDAECVHAQSGKREAEAIQKPGFFRAPTFSVEEGRKEQLQYCTVTP